MNEDDPQTLKRMLFYLYSLDYPDHDVPSMSAECGAVERYTPPPLRHKDSTTIDEVTEMSTDLELSESAPPLDPRMMSNVLVYAVAEKYDIPDLKALAKRKFQDVAESKWPLDDFHAVAEAVFSTTPDGDMGLRQTILDVCEEHFQEILRDEESRAGFLSVQAIAAVVLNAAVRKFDQDKVLLEGSTAKEIEMRIELSVAKADAKEALKRKEDWISEFDSLLKRAENIDGCRHCHEDFNGSLERVVPSFRFASHGGTPESLGMQLRCAKCRTKHVL